MTWTWLELELDSCYDSLKVSSFLFGKKFTCLIYFFIYSFIYLFICVSSENFQPPPPPWKGTGNLEGFRVSQIKNFPKEIKLEFFEVFCGLPFKKPSNGVLHLEVVFQQFFFLFFLHPFIPLKKNIYFVKR